MPRMGFELAIPAFERAKTVHALDRAATVIGDYRARKLPMENPRSSSWIHLVKLFNCYDSSSRS
jgi:hypothetical protein